MTVLFDMQAYVKYAQVSTDPWWFFPHTNVAAYSLL